MRIMVCTDVTVRGGVDGYVLDVIRALRRARHQVVLVLETSTTSSLRGAGAEIAGLTVRFAPLYRRHGIGLLRSTATALLAEFQPGGVHVVCGSPRSCLVLREVVNASGIELIVTEQQINETLVLSREEAERIRSSYQASAQVIFVSEGNRAVMDDQAGLDGVRVSVIPNGIDVDDIQARAQTAPPDRQGAVARLMCAARFAPEKSLDVLIRAVAVLPVDLPVQLDLFGEGPERERLGELADELGVAHCVRFLPWVRDIPEQLGAHDLFLLPSSAEGMSYALLEAMAAGIPIVATDVPGSAEALGQGDAGLLVPKGDPVALAAGIEECLRHRDEAAARARTALQRAASRYDRVTQMHRTTELWDSVSLGV